MKFETLYERLAPQMPDNEELYLKISHAIYDAAGDLAYDIVPDYKNGEFYGYPDEAIYHWFKKGQKDDVWDLVGYVADSLVSDPNWIAGYAPDRIYDIFREYDPKLKLKDFRDKVAELAAEAKSAREPAMEAALLDIAGKKKLKKPKYIKYVSKAEKAKAAKKRREEKLATLPGPPVNVASEINKKSKIAKGGKKTYQASDGNHYTEIGGRWYQLSEALVQELNLN